MKQSPSTRYQRGKRFSTGLLAFISTILLSMPVQAAGGLTPSSGETVSASQVIKDHIKFPDLSVPMEKEEKVNVVFTVNEAGQVNLVIANTPNLALRRSIEAQFMSLRLGQLKANNAYSIQFNFKIV